MSASNLLRPCGVSANLFYSLLPTLLKAKPTDTQQATGLFLSEKFEGVRATWDGNQLLTRTGTPLNPPAWFTDELPTHDDMCGCVFDGHLWIARGQSKAAQSLIRGRRDDIWTPVIYRVFDCISDKLAKFDRRYSTYQFIISRCNCAWLQSVPQTRCMSPDHFDRFFDDVVEQGGAGVIMRSVNALYVKNSRRPHLFQRVHEFTDPYRVVGRIGYALLCEVAGGADRFELHRGIDWQSPPQIDDIVVVKHCGLTMMGLPRNPSFEEVV